MNYEINLSFFIKSFSSMTRKVRTQKLNNLCMKRAFQLKQKAVLIIFIALSLKQLKPTAFGEKSPTLIENKDL